MKTQGKNLAFEDLRVAYNHREDNLILTSKDPALAKSGWKVILNKHTSGERVLRTLLQDAGLLRGTGDIPTYALYPTQDDHPWWEFPLGVGEDGQEAVLALRGTNSHALIGGVTGSGKSVIQRSLLLHAANTMVHWQVIGIDLKRVELGSYANAPLFGEFFTHVKDIEDAVEVLRQVRDVMHRRYSMLEQVGGTDMFDHVNRGQVKAIMVMIDEVVPLVANFDEHGNIIPPTGLQAEALNLIGELARLGRAAQVHVVVGSQRPDLRVLPGELRSNLATRILAGQVPVQASLNVLDDSHGFDLPRIKGRGMVKQGSDESQEVQFYFAPPSRIQDFR